MSEYHTADIKAALKVGQVALTRRGSGKTEAVVELMYEDRNYVVVAANKKMADLIAERYLKKYKENPSFYQLAIGTACLSFPDDAKVIVEELLMNPYRGKYWAATLTFERPFILIGEIKNDHDSQVSV